MTEIDPGSARPTCPRCGKPLIAEHKHGVELDVCEEHGVWLDAGELETVVMKLTARAGRRRGREVARARRSGKVSGALWGWWSLLGD